MDKIQDLPEVFNIDNEDYILIYDQNDFLFKIQRQNITFDVGNTPIGDTIETNKTDIEYYDGLIDDLNQTIDQGGLSATIQSISAWTLSSLSQIQTQLDELSQYLVELIALPLSGTQGYYVERSPSQFVLSTLSGLQIPNTYQIQIDHNFNQIPQRVEYNMKRIQDNGYSIETRLPALYSQDILNTLHHRNPLKIMNRYQLTDSIGQTGVIEPVITAPNLSSIIVLLPRGEQSGVISNVNWGYATYTWFQSNTSFGSSIRGLRNNGITSDISNPINFYREFEWSFKIYKNP